MKETGKIWGYKVDIKLMILLPMLSEIQHTKLYTKPAGLLNPSKSLTVMEFSLNATGIQ